MIYTPAPWKNFTFGGYYLKQTKIAKVDMFNKDVISNLNRSDISKLCSTLDTLGGVEWRVNKRVLETIEYVWSIGGGLGEIPKRFNERNITPEMIKEATFREKLKLLVEHQKNNDNHSSRCAFILRYHMA